MAFFAKLSQFASQFELFVDGQTAFELFKHVHRARVQLANKSDRRIAREFAAAVIGVFRIIERLPDLPALVIAQTLPPREISAA